MSEPVPSVVRFLPRTTSLSAMVCSFELTYPEIVHLVISQDRLLCLFVAQFAWMRAIIDPLRSFRSVHRRQTVFNASPRGSVRRPTSPKRRYLGTMLSAAGGRDDQHFHNRRQTIRAPQATSWLEWPRTPSTTQLALSGPRPFSASSTLCVCRRRLSRPPRPQTDPTLTIPR